MLHLRAVDGGYAAIRFSSAVAAETAITIVPQFAIDPRQPPFDTRWSKDAARVRFIHGETWLNVQAQVVAIYNNRGIDLRHIILYRRFVRLFEIGLPNAGHNPAQFLLSIGLLQDLIAGLLGEHFDAAKFRRVFREKRKTSPDYFFNLAKATRHLPRALALLDQALRLAPERPQMLGARARACSG